MLTTMEIPDRGIFIVSYSNPKIDQCCLDLSRVCIKKILLQLLQCTTMNNNVCVFCESNVDVNSPDTVSLREKGAKSVNEVSKSRNCPIEVSVGQRVHVLCRKQFVNWKTSASKRFKAESDSEKNTPVLRSKSLTFNFQENCFLCGKSKEIKCVANNTTIDVFQVRCDSINDSLKKICETRGDDWSQQVLGRINYINDLHAADAFYHQICSVNFRTGKNMPSLVVKPTVENASRGFCKGRKTDVERHEAFIKAMACLYENQEDQITIQDLILKMKELLPDENAYCFTFMKQKILEHFGTEVIIAEIDGKPNIVTVVNNASVILDKFYSSARNEDCEVEKFRIIKAAAELISSDVKLIESKSHSDYVPSDMESLEKQLDFLPTSLQRFLSGITAGKSYDIKAASVGQAIMKLIRPRLQAPLQVGLGVQMHHLFGSRFLIETLNRHGFSCGYKEIQNFERSAAVTQSLDLGLAPGSAMQFIADNADHNTQTLDGHGTFHGMAILAAITPEVKTKKTIPKRKTSNDEILVSKIDIRFYRALPPLALVYEDLPNIQANDRTHNLDILWKTSWFLKNPRPGWQGTMQMVHKGYHHGKSSLVMFPMIDMNSSDTTCVYSTLLFVCHQANRYNSTPVLTFDQPLWWKARCIIHNEPEESVIKSVVLKLGGFHLQMSFLGAIGQAMSGSGLQELLETIYAKNSVVHILDGHAFARAIRGHFLVDATLNVLLLKSMFNIDGVHDANGDATEPMQIEDADLQEIAILYENLMEGSVTAETASATAVLDRISERLQELKNSLSHQRTALLWLQYMDMIDLLKRFIKAERTGNWCLHLKTIQEMLPYFASLGRNMYTKSARLYLQKMLHLEDEHPEVYHQFQEGLHVIRRTDRLWAGLSSDLVIEQTVMKNMKSRGGLTRGRGMSELQRDIWIAAMPSCAEVHDSMQNITGLAYITSDQHKESSESRQVRDAKDTLKLLSFLSHMNPFEGEMSLRSIASGVVAHGKVNVDSAKAIGLEILQLMTKENALEFTFKKKDQAVNLTTKFSMKIDGEKINVDPQLLFQRFLIAAKASGDDDISSVFEYELCSHPSALFDSACLLLEANKPQIAETMWKLLGYGSTPAIDPENAVYVLDGGSLLHRLPWPAQATYHDIAIAYVSYVKKHYSNATIVFDGYDDVPCTKDVTHLRRSSKSSASATIQFEEEMIVPISKIQFLANGLNKQRFIHLLASKLAASGCSIHHASNDADLLIVQTAVELSKEHNTVLIGEDTDLLVLLCHHANMEFKDIIFRTEPKQNAKKISRIWNVTKTVRSLGCRISENMLFAHAFLGCDTTSRLFGFSKGIAITKLNSCDAFLREAKIFSQNQATHDMIEKAGTKIFLNLYSAKDGETLDTLRYRLFCEKANKSSSHVRPEQLPPTNSAAKNHSYRVYHQICAWKNIHLNAEEWGWILKRGKFHPITTERNPAPLHLLKVIRCNCKTDCLSMKCSCRKLGMNCSTACRHCQGISCTNTPLPDLQDDTEDEDDI